MSTRVSKDPIVPAELLPNIEAGLDMEYCQTVRFDGPYDTDLLFPGFVRTESVNVMGYYAQRYRSEFFDKPFGGFAIIEFGDGYDAFRPRDPSSEQIFVPASSERVFVPASGEELEDLLFSDRTTL